MDDFTPTTVDDFTPIGEKTMPEISQAPTEGLFNKVIGFFKDPDMEIAKAQNIYALSDVTGLPLREVNKNYDLLRRSVKVTGITPDLDRKEYMSMVMLPMIATGAVTNPIGTAAGLIAFGALNKVIPTDKLINHLKEQGISDEVITTIELADYVGKGLIIGGVFRKAPKLAENFLKQKITEYKLPSTLSLSAKQIRDIYQTGKLTTPEQQSLFGSLGLTGQDLRNSLESGIDINIPSEKIITLVDKPYWAKIKGIFKIAPTAEIRVLPVEKPTKAPAGLLEAKLEVKSLEELPKIIQQKAYNQFLKEGNKAPFETFLEDFRKSTFNPKTGEIVESVFPATVEKRLPVAKPEVTAPVSIPPELQPLAQEARKYKSAEEFVSKLDEKVWSDFVNYVHKEPIKEDLLPLYESIFHTRFATGQRTAEDIQRITDFYNQTTGVSPAKALPESKLPILEKALPPVSPLKKEEIAVGLPLEEKIPQEISPVKKVIQALREAKIIRGQQETLYTKARAEKFAKMQAVGKKVTGEKGFYAELGALKGELPKVEFEAIRSKLTQEDIDNLFIMVKDSRDIGEWEKLNAREGLAKLFGEYGGKVPTENEIALLHKVFGKEFTEALMEKRPLLTKMKEAGLQLANMPRSFMASFLDLSFGFRQGMFTVARYRKEFFSSFKKQFRWFASEQAFQENQRLISENPNYQLAVESGIRFTEMDSLISQREEKYASQWAEKIPVLGRVVRATSRAYTAFANRLRMDVFDRLVKQAEGMKLNPQENRDLSKSIADFVNNATGRGSLGSLERAALGLNAFFFSPRLMASRLKLLSKLVNPLFYIKEDPFVRKETLKTIFSFLGLGAIILTMAKLAGLEVGTDWRSSDFGKIKIGKTRIDIWGGFQQYVRMAGQLISGQYVSSVTGKVLTLGEGYKPLTRLDILVRQIESKEAPVFSFVTEMLKGQDFEGKPLDIPKEVGLRFTPMVIQDFYDLYKEDPQLLPVGILAIFGVGIQTYGEKSRKLQRKSLTTGGLKR